MLINYQQKEMTGTFKDTLESHLNNLFPGAEINISEGGDSLTIGDVDDLRYMKRLTSVVVSVIRLADYVSKEY